MNPSCTETLLAQLCGIADAMPDELLAACARKILGHERIFVYGAGRSGLMLRALAMRLMQAGRQVYVVGETTTPAIRQGDLLILASASGTTDSVCRHAATALSARAGLMVITASCPSPLTQLCMPDVILPVSSKDSPHAAGLPAMGTLFEAALLLFGDALISLMNVDPVLMRQNHANLE